MARQRAGATGALEPLTALIQTVEPLAAKLGLEVEVTDALAEGSPYERALELLAVVPDSSVLVSPAT